MSETRKLAAILVADVVGYSRLAGADEDRTLSRLRGLRTGAFDVALSICSGVTFLGALSYLFVVKDPIRNAASFGDQVRRTKNSKGRKRERR